MDVEHWRPYLVATEFIIRTDHRNLSCLDEERLTTPWQHKALTKLLGLQYRIEYRKGSANQAADALSRHPEATANAISVCVPRWLEEVKTGYAQDQQCSKILADAAVQEPAKGPFRVQDGLIRYKGRVWIGNNPAVQKKVLEELHS